MACIYCCKRKSDSKVVYVGLTIYTLDFRLNGEPYGHFILAFKKNSQTYFHKALRKYGKDAFTFEIIEERQDSDFSNRDEMNAWLNEREKYWIAYYNTFNEGYNQTTGGHDFYHRSEENKRVTSETTKRAMRKLNTKELCNPMKHMTEEEKIAWKAKISENTKKAMSKLNTKIACNPFKHMTEEEKQSYIERCNNKKRGKPAWNSGKQGVYSKEQLQRMSEAQQGSCWITNGEKEFRIKEVDIQKWLNKGFYRGRMIKISSTKGLIAVHNSLQKTKYIKKEDLQLMLSQGWLLGGAKRKPYKKKKEVL